VVYLAGRAIALATIPLTFVQPTVATVIGIRGLRQRCRHTIWVDDTLDRIRGEQFFCREALGLDLVHGHPVVRLAKAFKEPTVPSFDIHICSPLKGFAAIGARAQTGWLPASCYHLPVFYFAG
jgi:hypothetical protein